MQKTKEVLRLRFELGLGQRQIARSCGMGLATVHDYLERATAAGIGRSRRGAARGIADGRTAGTDDSGACAADDSGAARGRSRARGRAASLAACAPCSMSREGVELNS